MEDLRESNTLKLVPWNLAQGFVFREDIQAKLIHDGKEIFEEVVIQMADGNHAIALATKDWAYISWPNGEIFAKVLCYFQTPNRTIAHLRKTYTNTPGFRWWTSRPKVSMFLDLRTWEEVIVDGLKIEDIIEHGEYYEVIFLWETSKKETHFFYDKNWGRLQNQDKQKTPKRKRRNIDAEIYDEEKSRGHDFPKKPNTPWDTAIGAITERVFAEAWDRGYFDESDVRVSIFDWEKPLEIGRIEQTLLIPWLGKITGFVPKWGYRRRYFWEDKKVVYRDGKVVTSILHMSPHGTLIELDWGIEIFLPYNTWTNRVIGWSFEDVNILLDGKKLIDLTIL